MTNGSSATRRGSRTSTTPSHSATPRSATGSASPSHRSASAASRLTKRRIPDSPLALWTTKGPRLRPFLLWSVPGSNRRPPACKAGALPTELTPRGLYPSGFAGSDLCSREPLGAISQSSLIVRLHQRIEPRMRPITIRPKVRWQPEVDPSSKSPHPEHRLEDVEPHRLGVVSLHVLTQLVLRVAVVSSWAVRPPLC